MAYRFAANHNASQTEAELGTYTANTDVCSSHFASGMRHPQQYGLLKFPFGNMAPKILGLSVIIPDREEIS